MSVPCVVCRRNSLSGYCFLHKPKKPLRKEAVKTRAKRLDTRTEWMVNNPSDEWGWWYCYLDISPQCMKRMNIQTLVLEHVESKARHPERKYDPANLRPACDPCNELKGSRSADEVLGKVKITG